MQRYGGTPTPGMVPHRYILTPPSEKLGGFNRAKQQLNILSCLMLGATRCGDSESSDDSVAYFM